jgi:hypothetical protein
MQKSNPGTKGFYLRQIGPLKDSVSGPRYTVIICSLDFPAINCLSTYCRIPPFA